MTTTERQANAETRKGRIAERYNGIDPSKLEVIPARISASVNISEQRLKVAAYIRVSTDNDEQQSSFNLQRKEFTDRINANPLWENAGIYSDEGISGTELSHRKGMLQMINDAKEGKIQLILAKSIARFARNVVDCLSIIEELKQLNPPVGVYFDESNLYTLDSTGALVLTILATVAEEESRSKSFIMNWSIDKRFSKGIFLTPDLLGYDRDEDGNLIVNADEAETVKVIYSLYLNGWRYREIADLLTQHGRRTKLGNTVWNPGSINGIVRNERNCGDVLARKTYTPSFKDHKSKKNRKDRTQYRQRNHHEAIVSRTVYDAANKVQSSMHFTKGNRALPVLSVVDHGILQGYVPIHKDWTGFSGDEYKAASESVDAEALIEMHPTGRQLNMTGYQAIRGEFYDQRNRPLMTISAGKLRFNTFCLKRFRDVEYIELLLNTTNRCIAIRPCDADNPNAIRWGKLSSDHWAVRQTSCHGLSHVLVDLMDWATQDQYRMYGQYMEKDGGKLLLFSLDDTSITKMDAYVQVPEKEDAIEGEEVSHMPHEESASCDPIEVYHGPRAEKYGKPIMSIRTVPLLEQKHYSGDWDVLRPAREVEKLCILTRKELLQLIHEAEDIIERWGEANV